MPNATTGSARSSRRRPAASRAAQRTRPLAQGRLVLVVGADPVGRDLVLAAVRRRLRAAGAPEAIEFPSRISTRRRTSALHTLTVSRRVFEDMRREGSLLLQWTDELGSHGLSVDARTALERGALVVVGVPPGAEADARLAWPDVRVVSLTTATDVARAPLSAKACFERLITVPQSGAALVRPPAASIHCPAGLTPAIDRLTRAVLAQVPARRAAS